jgi:hypothetical protein
MLNASLWMTVTGEALLTEVDEAFDSHSELSGMAGIPF